MVVEESSDSMVRLVGEIDKKLSEEGGGGNM